MAVLGAASCGGGGEEGGAGSITFTFGLDEGGGLQTLIDRFNEQNKGGIQVTWRQTPAASDEYFDQIRSQLQSGKQEVDVIGGDVIWPAQFAASGFILDLSDRFTAGMRERYLDGPRAAVIYEGKIYGVPWFATPGCSTIAKISWSSERLLRASQDLG